MHFIIHTQDITRVVVKVISSTGLKISNDDSANEHFLDDDGEGNLRVYYLSGHN